VDDDHRGNCFPSCVASIFALPLSAVPRSEHKMEAWLADRYPGVGMMKRTYMEPHPEFPYEFVSVFQERPPYYPGLWIATVESPRFTTRCHRCAGEGEIRVYLDAWVEGVADEDRDSRMVACHECGGDGRTSGLHAVVMSGAILAWDPSPQREEGFGRFHGEVVFVVTDGSKLVRSARPLSIRT
jgi:hypothetical protein